MTAAIVLAGGRSARFGGDKLAAELDGRPLLHHALDAVAAVAGIVVIVLAPDAPEPALPGALAGRIVLARDEAAYRGPLAGLAAGLSALPGRAAGREGDQGADNEEVALVVGGDMPRLVPAVLRLLVDALIAEPSLGAAILEADPPATLPMAVRPSLAGRAARAVLAEDRRALRALLDRLPTHLVPASAWHALDPDLVTLTDVDRRADLGST